MWPDLSAFPPWINALAGALFALGVAAVSVAAFYGKIRGSLTPPEAQAGSAQIAMMSLDSTAIREHTAAVQLVATEFHGIATELHQLVSLGREHMNLLEARQEEAELRDAEQRGYERAQAERVRSTRRPTAKKSQNFSPEGSR